MGHAAAVAGRLGAVYHHAARLFGSDDAAQTATSHAAELPLRGADPAHAANDDRPAIPLAMTTKLSVNLNKVALVRNTRHLGIPSVTRAATLCLEAGARGITVHPRPDERHIRVSDVIELAALLKDWPDREYNIEGNPFHNLMDVVGQLVAHKFPVHQMTFVPDSEGQFTSDHGWSFP